MKKPDPDVQALILAIREAKAKETPVDEAKRLNRGDRNSPCNGFGR